MEIRIFFGLRQGMRPGVWPKGRTAGAARLGSLAFTGKSQSCGPDDDMILDRTELPARYRLHQDQWRLTGMWDAGRTRLRPVSHSGDYSAWRPVKWSGACAVAVTT